MFVSGHGASAWRRGRLGGRTMIGSLGMGGVAREQEQARHSRAWRVTAVLGMLAVPLAAAGITAAPAAAASIGYTVTATIGVGSGPEGVGVDPSTHTVYVANSNGNSVSVIAPPQPGPVDVTATAGNTAAIVSWTAPPYFLDGATVTGYSATASPGGETCSTTGATSCTITGLTNDTTYSITVVAHTTAGDYAADIVTVVPWGAHVPVHPVAGDRAAVGGLRGRD
jgi:Fibronectin type III domain